MPRKLLVKYTTLGTMKITSLKIRNRILLYVGKEKYAFQKLAVNIIPECEILKSFPLTSHMEQNSCPRDSNYLTFFLIIITTMGRFFKLNKQLKFKRNKKSDSDRLLWLQCKKTTENQLKRHFL